MVKIKIFNKEIYVGKAVLGAAVFLIALVLGSIGFLINKNSNHITISSNIEGSTQNSLEANITPTPAESGETKQTNERKIDDKIKVYVVGCVKQQGIVTIEKGQLIDDAIKAAGGFTEEADISNINLVYPLNENVMINVKPKTKPQTQTVVKPAASIQSKSGEEAGSGAVIVKDSGGAIAKSEDTQTQAKAKGKVNINTASINEMDTVLPGIGVETAKDIVAYREKNGNFKTIKDIMKVSGIKESKYSKIKDLITVD